MAGAAMVGRFGSAAYTDGFRVKTTVSSERQLAANLALDNGLIEYDQRHGYRGPEARLAELSRDSWPSALAKYRRLSGLQPAGTTQVGPSGIMVLTSDGNENALAWDSMQWDWTHPGIKHKTEQES